jgi:hypothetical protein
MTFRDVNKQTNLLLQSYFKKKHWCRSQVGLSSVSQFSEQRTCPYTTVLLTENPFSRAISHQFLVPGYYGRATRNR